MRSVYSIRKIIAFLLCVAVAIASVPFSANENKVYAATQLQGVIANFTGSNVNTTEAENNIVVAFGGYDWYVVGAKDAAGSALESSIAKGPPSAAPTSSLTLLFKAYAGGQGADTIFGAGNAYAGSTLAEKIDAFSETALSAELSLIEERDLLGGSANFTFSSAATSTYIPAGTSFANVEKTASATEFVGDYSRGVEANALFDWNTYRNTRAANGYTGSYYPDGIAGAAVDDAKFWPLSVAEASLLQPALRSFGNKAWWLRTPGEAASGFYYSSYVSSANRVLTRGSLASQSYSVRPAFYLDTDATLLVSDDTGSYAKPTASSPTPLALAWDGASNRTKKITAQVASGGPALASAKTVSLSGNTLIVSYEGASLGANIAAILYNSAGAPQYYWLLANSVSSASGILNITLPTNYASSSTLKIFAEQRNSGKYADITSAPITITLAGKANQAAPSGVPTGTAIATDKIQINSPNALYEYRYKLASAGESAWSDPISYTSGSLVISGLAENTGYVVQMRYKETDAYYASAWSGSSATITTQSSAATPPSLAGSVTLVGDAIVGNTLVANTSGLTTSPAGGNYGTLYLQWQTRSDSASAWTNIQGATSISYVLLQSDAGKQIRLHITAQNATGEVNSAAVTVEEPAPVLTLLGEVTIAGDPVLGQVLEANTAALYPSVSGADLGAFSYVWKRDGSPFAGGTSKTYTVASVDIGHSLTVTVTAANATGSQTSAAVVPQDRATLIGSILVQDENGVSLRDTAEYGDNIDQGNSLRAIGVLSTSTGIAVGERTYIWQRNGSPIGGATGIDMDTYTLVAADIGQSISVKITTTNTSGSVVSDPLLIHGVHEKTPAVSIDYANEQLTGFELDADASYSINDGAAFAPGDSGTVNIEEEWLDTTLTIVRKARANDPYYDDSEEYELYIPARPAAPIADAFAETGYSLDNGRIVVDGAGATQYRLTNTQTWLSNPDGQISSLAPGTYDVRKKATSSAFASFATQVTVETYGLLETTMPAISIDYANELLVGFVTYEGATYSINGGAAFAANSDGTYPLTVTTKSQTLVITRKSANTALYFDSASQVLEVPARPAAPSNLEVKNITWADNGAILVHSETPPHGDLEYRYGTGEWIAWNGNEALNPDTEAYELGSLKAGEMSVRFVSKQPTDIRAGRFASLPVVLTIRLESVAATVPEIRASGDVEILSIGAFGQAYSKVITATASGIVEWFVVSGALPDGLSLDSFSGAITGTPSKAGIFDFTIRAQNEAGGATQKYKLVINKAVPTIVSNKVYVTYTGTSIDLSAASLALFGVNPNNLSATYSLAALSSTDKGEGTLTAGKTLTVTKAGRFLIDLTIPETANYAGVTSAIPAVLIVQKGTPTLSVRIGNWLYGQPYKTPQLSKQGGSIPGTSDIVVEYAAIGTDAYTKTVPSTAGEWTIRASLAQDDLWTAATATHNFEIVSSLAANSWIQIPRGTGSWYYYGSKGDFVTGWQYVKGQNGESAAWRYFDDETGEAGRGWQDITRNGKTETYYFWSKGDGTYAKGVVSGITMRDGTEARMFYFDGSGHLQKGWKYAPGPNGGAYAWRYFEDETGAAGKGWTDIVRSGGTATYYFWSKGDGTYATGLQSGLTSKTGKTGKTYFFGSNGQVKTGWQDVNGKGDKRYFMTQADNPDLVGAAPNSWLDITENGKTYSYYFWSNGSGKYATGLQQNLSTQAGGGSRTYYFASDGHMQTGWQTVGGVGRYFATKDDVEAFLLDKVGTPYATANGEYVVGDEGFAIPYGASPQGWTALEGNIYYFKDDGAYLVGTQRIDGYMYFFNKNGYLRGIIPENEYVI